MFTGVVKGELFLLVCSEVNLLSKKKKKLPEVITSSQSPFWRVGNIN